MVQARLGYGTTILDSVHEIHQGLQLEHSNT